MSGSDQTADDGDALSLGGNLFDSLAIARDEGWALDKIAGRVSANRQLGKKDKSGAAGLRAAGIVDDLIPIAGEISDRGVDLPEGDLHLFSVKLWCRKAKCGRR